MTRKNSQYSQGEGHSTEQRSHPFSDFWVESDVVLWGGTEVPQASACPQNHGCLTCSFSLSPVSRSLSRVIWSLKKETPCLWVLSFFPSLDKMATGSGCGVHLQLALLAAGSHLPNPRCVEWWLLMLTAGPTTRSLSGSGLSGRKMPLPA